MYLKDYTCCEIWTQQSSKHSLMRVLVQRGGQTIWDSGLFKYDEYLEVLCKAYQVKSENEIVLG